MEDDDFIRKPSVLTFECEEMLEEALDYIASDSQKQAEIMQERFSEIRRILETMPGIGTIYQNGMRKIKLGKFRYNIFYVERKDIIEILGIWHTSRGTAFKAPKNRPKVTFGLSRSRKR
jgi:plasmid stabilization system protein ParE